MIPHSLKPIDLFHKSAVNEHYLARIFCPKFTQTNNQLLVFTIIVIEAYSIINSYINYM